MSYSTKFASQLLRSVPDGGRLGAEAWRAREHYQIDVRSRTDAIGSSVRCANEGADLLMVKPGMTSLDLIAPIREATGRLVGAYQVSGEYAGLCALGRDGLADFDAALLETWHVFRRAGAAYIITYGARHARIARSAGDERSRGALRAIAARGAGRRAQSRCARSIRVGGLPIFIERGVGRDADRRHRPRATSISVRASVRCCSATATLTCAPPSAEALERRLDVWRAASRTRWRWPSGSPRTCRGPSTFALSRRAPRR